MKKINFARAGWLIIVIIVLGPLWAISINIFGIPQTVTVSFYKEIRQVRRIPNIVSCGYYYVNSKRYTALIDKKVPIGTKFEIKYSPIIPREYNTIRVIQE